MEFLVELQMIVPEGATDAEIEAHTQAETTAAVELGQAGHLERVWTVSRAPGRWNGLSLYRADSETELLGILHHLPLARAGWMSAIVKPLEPSANDPNPL